MAHLQPSTGLCLLSIHQGLKTSTVSDILPFLSDLQNAMFGGLIPGISVEFVMELMTFLASVCETKITGSFLDIVKIKVSLLLHELLLKNNISDESRDEILRITKNIRTFSDELIVFFKEVL